MMDMRNRELLLQIITRLEATSEDEWCTAIVSNGDTRCCLGHVFDMGATVQEANQWWNWFEDFVATTYMIYPVNDGEHPGYQQATPKARVLAYLHGILDGREKTSWEAMEDNAKFSLSGGQADEH